MWLPNWTFSLPSWAVSNSLQKRLVKFLLRRTIGPFLKTDLDDADLDVQLSSGQMKLKNVQLSEEALNDAVSGLPIVVESGTIGQISVSIPWAQLWTGHCEIQVDELLLKTTIEDDIKYSSMSNSTELRPEGGNEPGRKFNLAESVAMTEGGSSILTSSVFIADDFLRREALGYGDKDELILYKDVERMVANVHEEQEKYRRGPSQLSSDRHAPKSAKNNAAFPWSGGVGGKGDGPLSSAVPSTSLPAAAAATSFTHEQDLDGNENYEDDDSYNAPMAPPSPGGSIQGLQVISEMVDRIISSVNVGINNITVECSMVSVDETHDRETDILKLTIGSVSLRDDMSSKASRSAYSSASSKDNMKNKTENSTSTSSEDIAAETSELGTQGNAAISPDHPLGIEYKVVEFRTLSKVIEIQGLRVSICTSDANEARENFPETTLVSTFKQPMVAHLRIHRRLPFSELAPVTASGDTRRRRTSAESAMYVGPMPGEFREAKSSAQETRPMEVPPIQTNIGSRRTRNRNLVGDDPTYNGWDISIDIDDIGFIVTGEQIRRIRLLSRILSILLKQSSKRNAILAQYQNEFPDPIIDATSNTAFKLARWININCSRIFFAVVPEAVKTLDTWYNTSIAVTRLNLESVKHVGIYLKRVGFRWEVIPTTSPTSAPAASTAYMDTEFWAAMSRKAAAENIYEHTSKSGQVPPNNEGTLTISAYIRKINIYDSDPACYPVVHPLLQVDHSLNKSAQEPNTIASKKKKNVNPDKCDIWLSSSNEDLTFVINVGPVDVKLSKEHAARLNVYLELLDRTKPRVRSSSVRRESTTKPELSSHHKERSNDVSDSIEILMGKLRSNTEQAMPSNIAVCSPLIRVWLALPHMEDHGTKGSRKGDDSTASEHFCIDCIDTVITNVVNGTATSSQEQGCNASLGHMRHPYIQELLESRNNVAGSGIRLECETLRLHVQPAEGKAPLEQIACIHGPTGIPSAAFEEVSIPRPHIEITTVREIKPTSDLGSEYDTKVYSKRPPAFDAFSAVDDEIRVRMAPESELTTSIEFEQHAVSHSQLIISCHLPEAEIGISSSAYKRVHAIVNEFLFWQSIQETSQRPQSDPNDMDKNSKTPLKLSVMVDVPVVVAKVSTDDIYIGDGSITIANTKASLPRKYIQDTIRSSFDRSFEHSQKMQLTNTRFFLSNSTVEKGRMYISLESNQVRLSSFENDIEGDVVLSHTFATPEEPIITPQLSAYLLTTQSIMEESEAVLKIAWTTFDYSPMSTCFQDLEAFFSSSGTSEIVQPPPKPMRLSLNIQNSSFRWLPSEDPGLSSAVASLDSLAVIVKLNSLAPDRDNEHLHYYIEGLSLFGKAAGSLNTVPEKVSSDAWVSTGRFWKMHNYSTMLHADMVDLASKTKENEEGPLFNFKLYGEALVVDACSDSIASIPMLIQGLLKSINGSNNQPDIDEGDHHTRSANKKGKSADFDIPHVIDRKVDDIFGDIEEDTFAQARSNIVSQLHSRHAPQQIPRSQKTAVAHILSVSSSHSIDDTGSSVDAADVGDDGYDYDFTYEFEQGGGDISELVLDEYFGEQPQSDAMDEYEVVQEPLSPKSQVYPTYSHSSRHSSQQPIRKGPSRNWNSGSQRQLNAVTTAIIGDKSSPIPSSKRSHTFGASDAPHFGFYDYTNMDDASDLSAEDEAGYMDSIARDIDVAEASVVLEPKPLVIRESRPKATRDYKEEDKGTNDNVDVKIIVSVPDPKEDNIPNISDANGGPDDIGFNLIDDYFAPPVPGESIDGSDVSADNRERVLSLALDVGRIEINLHSGQDWYTANESAGDQMFSPTSPTGFSPGYFDESMSELGRSAVASPSSRKSASLPEPRGMFESEMDMRHSRKYMKRSAKPKIRARATHVHAEYERYSDTASLSYGLLVNVGLLEVLDELESSEWSKMLTRRRDQKTGLPASLYTLAAGSKNRKVYTSGTSDSDRVTSWNRRQSGGKWANSNADPILSIQIEAVRPFETLDMEELRMDVEISPLRCYLHQDALDFIIRFVEGAETHSADIRRCNAADSAESSRGGPSGVVDNIHSRIEQMKQTRAKKRAVQPYFQIVRVAPLNVIFDYKPRRMRVSPGMQKGGGNNNSSSINTGSGAAASSGGNPSSKESRDAAPKKSKAGPVELLNFFPLEDAEMTLNAVKVRGATGVSKLVRELATAWLPHITHTQIPGVVSGVAPIRSLVNIGNGVADLIILPIEQYRKDGRVVKGVKRGAKSFVRTTALEALHLGAKVAVNAQTLLEQAGDILNIEVSDAVGGDSDAGSAPHSHDSRGEGSSALSRRASSAAGYGLAIETGETSDFGVPRALSSIGGGIDYEGEPSRRRSREGAGRHVEFGKSKYARQPETFGEGMRQAYQSLRANVGDAVQTILAIPVEINEGEEGDGREWESDPAGDGSGGTATGRSAVHGSVRAVVRAVPVAVLKPMIGATEAVSKTLLGLRNTMEPARRTQLEDKYKGRRGTKAKKR